MKRSLLEVQRSFFRNARLRLVFLAVVLGAAWCFGAVSTLSGDERMLWEKVRNAQEYLFRWREGRGIAPEAGTDRERTGFIGVEWSPLTTTLGPLGAKRTAADPLWAVHALRRFRALGIGEGDRVALVSSSSFRNLSARSGAAEAPGGGGSVDHSSEPPRGAQQPHPWPYGFSPPAGNLSRRTVFRE